jgi:hypothetical protein
MLIKAFNDQVVFDVIGHRTMLRGVLTTDYQQLRPDLIENRDGLLHYREDTAEVEALSTMTWCLSRTHTIQFEIREDGDPEGVIASLQAWWQGAVRSGNRELTFSEFLLLAPDVRSKWQLGLVAATPQRPYGPTELRPGVQEAVENDEVKNDDFLADTENSVFASTKTSAPKSGRKSTTKKT